MPSTAIRSLTEESRDMRFDIGGARLEVWVTQDDLEYDRRIVALRDSTQPMEAKILAAKQVAMDLVNRRISECGQTCGFEITADVSLSDINVERIRWAEILEPPVEEPDEG
jgi:hypothetical protein